MKNNENTLKRYVHMKNSYHAMSDMILNVIIENGNKFMFLRI